MAIRKTAQYSPFNAQVIEVDHFSAIAANDPNELEYKIEVALDLDSYSFPDDAELDLEVLSGENLFTADLEVSFSHNPKKTFTFDAKPNSIRMRLRVTPKRYNPFNRLLKASRMLLIVIADTGSIKASWSSNLDF